MLWFLRCLFVLVLASMLGVTTWASLQVPLFEVPREVYAHPWFLATLLDAYWGFLTFYVWLAWKEQSLAARLLWLVAVLLLGNIAMALYVLGELTRVEGDQALSKLVTERRPGNLGLPAVLVGLAGLVYLLA